MQSLVDDHQLIKNYCTVYVKCIDGIDNFQLRVPKDCEIKVLKQKIKDQLPPQILSRTSISSIGGIDISRYYTVEELYNFTTKDHKGDIPMFLNLKINICLCGGKGGFGQLLKAKGHQMNKKNRKSQKSNSKDLYKTLDGRRVKSVRRLKQLDDYMNTLDEVEKSRLVEKRNKLQRILDIDLEKNVKFDDTKFLDDIDKQIEEIRVSVNMKFSNVDSGSNSDSESNDESDDEFDSQDEVKDEDEASTSKPIVPSKKAKFLNFFDKPPPKESKSET